ncbi:MULTISPECIES: glutamate--tRNA ligase [Bartonella]|uniref:Glutamate--tRNA ligase n=1 Tax=Bartonella rochalimae ATCC BAA-1498 TaxID=685782 RepID=E6YM40_9HYPH|nr:MULTISPECIES: glutamate--tRNA ligase [Bartonella]AQX18258.1 glutamyl-tRNA synthetase [Bartonella sp. A1379B]AQX22773.1 glutamyl-tRNA synthetase [Bartonella sp. 11B]AQX23940.1 glutamyl-tRNA synthetase [Bartonella sp. 114]AQX25223.1 glutamyl-tRNA synthetase [Bartonella sp. Coyote22sub2]KEC56921.1 glutamyl-tRNA synthetase 2 [Bartonella rochalimae ATCC BAA-1498]
MIKVRFAPSPTGYIHIGNTRIALFNWLYAKAHNGTFILRYDDTDAERSKQEYIDALMVDLEWLSIQPDEVYYQSKRFNRYDEVAEVLKQRGLLYPCYETAEELDRRRKIQLSRKLPPVYNRDALKLALEDKKAFEDQGRKPHWRFLLPNFESNPFQTKRTEVYWDDIVKGRQMIDLASMSDPVLIREDGSYLYTLPSVVDDIDMAITHIIRGGDHVANTAAQITLFKALDAVPPIFGHINLLTTASGEGLSKRNSDLSIRSLREDGFESMAVQCLAVLIGTSQNVQAYSNQDTLLKHFHLEDTSKSSAKFDVADLLVLNSHFVHELTYEDIKTRLEKFSIHGEQAEYFWNTVKNNITKLNDAALWWKIIHTDKSFDIISPEDRVYAQQSVHSLPDGVLNDESWKIWTTALQEKTGRKGKALFMPLRQALTGITHGPEMGKFLPLLGREKVVKRLTTVGSGKL